MIIEIKDEKLNFKPTIRGFADVVKYRKVYEKENSVSLTQYMKQVYDLENYAFDIVCDLIFYPYAIEQRNLGKKPTLSYEDVFEWLVENMDRIQEFSNELTESFPEVKEEDIKKKVEKN